MMIIAVFHRKLIWPHVRGLSKLKRHLLDLTLWTTVLRATTTIDRWRHICFHLRFQSKFTCFYTLERCEQCKKQVVQLQTQNNMQKFTVIKRLTGAKNGLVVLNIWIGNFSFVTFHPFMLKSCHLFSTLAAVFGNMSQLFQLTFFWSIMLAKVWKTIFRPISSNVQFDFIWH